MKRDKKINEIMYGLRTMHAEKFWSDEEAQQIELIQIKYQFRSYDLALKLLEKINALKGITEVIKCNPSNKEQLAYLQEFQGAADWLRDLNNENKMGRTIKNRLLKHSQNPSTLKNLDKLLDEVDSVLTQSIMAIKYEKSNHSNNNSNTLPKNDDGYNKKTIIKPLLHCLCSVFLEGSVMPPTHGTDAYSDEYPPKGNLYNFIMDLRPILKKRFSVKIGTPKTIGRYLNDIKSKINTNRK
ncbi:TPA: hypothetical protein ACK8S1_000047 [Legionella pneumophila]